MVKQVLSTKAEQPTIDRLDVLAAAMAEAAGLTEVSRSAALGACLIAGLEVLEARHGLGAAKTTKKGTGKPARKPAK